MLPNSEEGYGEAEEEEGLVPSAGFPEGGKGFVITLVMKAGSKMSHDREGGCGGHRGDGDVSSGEKNDGKNEDEEHYRSRHERYEDASGSGDAFPALEAEPRGVVVAKDGKERCHHVNDLHEKLLGGGEGCAEIVEEGEVDGGLAFAELEKVDGQYDREKAFENVEDEAKNAGSFAKSAEDIGRSYVARAVFADVDSFESFSDEESKGSRCHKECDERKDVRHSGRLAFVEKRKRRVCDPPAKVCERDTEDRCLLEFGGFNVI